MADFATGSEMESYLRVMQMGGRVPLYPWSIRGFSRREIERLVTADSTGPWKLQQRFNRARLAAGPLALGATFNSAFPYGANDGPLWAGRGLTVSATAGLSGHAGPFSFALAPIAFSARNTAFDLLPNGRAGAQAFNHGSFPNAIDFPQRFGASSYSRIDPGASGIRFDSNPLTLGISTTNQWIGPATEYPFLLGTNAPGFPHVFVGTGTPFNIWIGRAHARVTWGTEDQSDYSPVAGSARFISRAESGTRRLATHATLLLLPRGVTGLEVGFARFIHVPYTVGEPSGDFWRKPFKVFFLKNEYAQGDSAGDDNQLASMFIRWVFPRAGFELYGERGYEDQFYDLREFFQNPDHLREYMLGFQKIVRDEGGCLDVLKGELINFQRSTQALIRHEGGVYLHSTLRQGHTNRGQLLGASSGAGASAASVLSWTRYSPLGRTTATLRRIVRNQRGDYPETETVDPKGSDVIVAAGIERMRFGQRIDIGAKFEVMQNLNRNFSHDVANLNIELTARLRP
ncbi:MAG: hypothetical protein WD802_08855 [Gemmatimonadaceae bacterium]